MKRIDLKVGFQCNNLCRFCVQGDKRKIYPNKTDKEVRNILKENAAHRQGVVFTGGEPTIRKELVGWVAYAKDLGYKAIQIQTNGRLFAYKDYCRALIKAGANEFGPAVHGSTAKIHDSLTCSPGSFKQTIRGIKNLVSLDQYVGTNSVINKINYRDLPKLAELLVSLGVNQFQFAFIHINRIIASNQKLVEEIIPRHSAVEPYVKKGLQIGVKAGIPVMTEAIPYCLMGGYEDFVVEKNIPDTNVYDADFQVEDYTNYRRNLGKARGPACPKCKYFKICEGPWKEYPELFGWSEFKPVKIKNGQRLKK